MKEATIKTAKTFTLILVAILLCLTIYQVSKRVHWDLSEKRYSIATRYEDIEKASSLYEETQYGLVEKLNRSGCKMVLFGVDLAIGKKFSRPRVLGDLKEASITRGVEISNLQLVDDGDFREILSYLKAIEPKFVILRGSGTIEVPSYLASYLKEKDVIIGTVEFRTRETTANLVENYGLDWVRLHRVFEKEVGTLTRTEKEARFERAVQERNIGVIEYRLPLTTGLTENIETLTSIRDGLAGSGYDLSPLEDVKGTGKDLRSPTWLILALIVISMVLLIYLLIPDRSLRANRIRILAIVGSTTGGLAGLYYYPTLTRQSVALLIAIAVPIIDFKLVKNYGLTFNDTRNLLYPFLDLTWISALSTFGGLIVSSLLLDESFLLKLHQFRGVKVSLFLPLVILGFIALIQTEFSISELKTDYKKGLASLALLGLFLFLLLRSGNFTFLRSGDLEETIRRWLENTMYVRPRFKEFALGHPSMIAWLFLAGQYGKKLHFCKLVLLLLGFVGQISIINTFAHIHTPVLVSLIRTGNGLAVGLILGAIFLAVILGGEYVWNTRKG